MRIQEHDKIFPYDTKSATTSQTVKTTKPKPAWISYLFFLHLQSARESHNQSQTISPPENPPNLPRNNDTLELPIEYSIRLRAAGPPVYTSSPARALANFP
jgi:hypothetical protein